MPRCAVRIRRLRRRALVPLLVACSAPAGLAGCGSQAPPPPALSKAAVLHAITEPTPAATPAAERRLQRAGNTLIAGDGKGALRQLNGLLSALKGTPVVLNLWGDWCIPCKTELPVFQRAAIADRGKVAFIGIATRTTRGDTERYLSGKISLPYPSIFDPDEQVNHKTGVDAIPKTIIYTRSRAKAPFIHMGGYASVADLQADIQRYSQ